MLGLRGLQLGLTTVDAEADTSTETEDPGYWLWDDGGEILWDEGGNIIIDG